MWDILALRYFFFLNIQDFIFYRKEQNRQNKYN